MSAGSVVERRQGPRLWRDRPFAIQGVHLAREVLLIETLNDLAVVLAFAGTLFGAIRLNSSYSPKTLANNHAHANDDVAWLAELLHDVDALAQPVAKGDYAKAARMADSLARGITWLTSEPLQPFSADHPWAHERAVLDGMLGRWAASFKPSLPAVLQALQRLAQTCSALDATYA